MVKLLLSRETGVEERNWNVDTALALAVVNRDEQVAKLLLGKGAHVGQREVMMVQ
jgi:ankyrin repeat protein